MAYEDILKLTPTLQAAALAEYNYGLLKKKKKKARDFVEYGVGSIVGTSFIDATADLV
jgi:hypothetical protein